ncbi:MAG: PQQ-binding-like beta-propeller repeat protein [Armatimonadota bacterium]
MQRSSRRRPAGILIPLLAALTAAAAVAQPAANGPWAQFRGPERTGISRESGLLKRWPAGGPALVWNVSELGTDNSTPSVSGGRIFGMSYRGNDELIWAREEATGKPIWSERIAAATFDIGRQAHDGSGGTPTVDGDRLYALGMGGDLVCMQVSDGKLLWQKNLVRDFGGAVPQWGFSESPLVDGNRVIVTPGGREATLVALDRSNGEVIWKSQVPQGDAAGYASAIAAEVNGQRQYIQFLGGGVVGVAADTGRFLWRYNSPANRTANCSTPIFHDNHVFAASGYSTGGGLAKLETAPDGGMSATEVYFTRSMRNHHGGMVLVDGYVYGFDEANLTCIDFKTGEVKWSNRSVGKGSVTYADGHLYARSERGPVALVEATPQGYVEKGRFEQPDRSGKTTWPYPVIANGRLYLRDHDTLLCFNVKAGE